ncbi:uncharacterized protein FOMMEDRAFT_146574 [Fomitiporia mediterranea MF3/22]|uniref:uncharacterized protein n=1 Tax=Fomitiporia mediterranea (strain MF3/22) TaxID=694068 RepID=UPI000440799B|nr:uncharacterized protein FOMMEDRAFT_146574 [Fomitiporia mediterranea MF3/22]EJD02705.1 hypothetical protein FOMMEDRAFT_146574 [Fomitiporia mediterranea MF3/22]
MKNEIATSVAANLELDQIMTLYPDADTPFENELDVVHRLLPYHIFQHPQHDLNEMRGLKGKAKANEADLLLEIQETKFALECHRRFRSLEHRMKKARLKPGQNTIPLDQAILVERLLLESEHLDSSALDQELSSARSELDKVLRAQRLAKQTANRSTLTTSGSTSINGTTNHTTPSYYGYATSTFNASSTPNYSNYYSSYTYPYAQSFIPGVSHTQSAKTGTSAIPGASSFPTGASAQVQSSTSSTNQANASSPSTSAPARPPPVAIPLQLPVTSLPALQSLGILPVPQASLASSPNQQPAAVLLGSSNNGTMLSLEINAALLQPPQMSGLAILLSSLVKMSGGSSDTGQTQTAGTGATTTTQNASNSAATAQTATDTAAGYKNGSK